MSVGILVLAPVANAPLFLLSFETVKLSIHCNELPTMKIDGIVLVDNAWESPIFAEFCTWFAEQTVVPPLYRWTSSNEGSLLTCVSSKRRVRIAQDYYSNLCQSNTVGFWHGELIFFTQPFQRIRYRNGPAPHLSVCKRQKPMPNNFHCWNDFWKIGAKLNNWQPRKQCGTNTKIKCFPWRRIQRNWIRSSSRTRTSVKCWSIQIF